MPSTVKAANANTRNQARPQKPQGQKFTNGHEIYEALRVQNQEILLQSLTTLRNQLSLKSTEDVLSPTDERLLLAHNWLEQRQNGQELFELWDASGPKQNSILSLLLAILSSLLDLLSHHYPFQTTGHAILKVLLSQQYVRRLNSYIGGSQNELILLSLKLYNSMSNFAGGREKKLVLESFAWEMKSLPKLFSMRRKTKSGDTVDPLQLPDIRTLYILFLLSFVTPSTSASIKAAFLEQHREQFLLMFKGLNQDPYNVIRRITDICWTGIWSDTKVKRTLKISLFNESTLGHIMKLYERSSAEQDNPDNIPANLIHHFLLAICTRPGVGICFKDQGWYPRDADLDVAPAGELDAAGKYRSGSAATGKIYNKILSNFLKTLKVNEDARQQELALRILSSCPELVTGYWSSASLTLEPRLSSKWITNVAWFGTVVSLPVQTWCFHLETTNTNVKNGEPRMYKPTPPPLSTILSSFLPSSIPTKMNFTKGLQSSSGLVQHCTAIALVKCLEKYQAVLDAFLEVEKALEEVEGEGQWGKRRKEVEREVRKRVPDFQVVVSFSQQKFGLEVAGSKAGPTPTKTMTDGETVEEGEPRKEERNEVKAAMLSEIAYRLLWMYHRCLPAVVGEARFDVGKLLVHCGFTETHIAGEDMRDDGEDEDEEEEEGNEEEGDERMRGVEATGAVAVEDDAEAEAEESEEDDEDNDGEELDKSEQLGLLKGLHVLRLLKESEQFVWSAKSGTSGETYFSTLLKAHATSSPHSPTRAALSDLLQHVLSQSILFQEDPSEASLWLLCLPTYRRRPGTSAPDDAPLEDEVEDVVTFLDDCVQRCLKTPHKYVEELYNVRPTPTPGEDVTMGEPSVPPATASRLDVYPSPLLMTVLEQFSIKVQKKLLSPSAVLALATFTRKLGFRLLQKMDDNRFLLGVCDRLDTFLKENMFSEFGTMTAAIRREVSLLRAFVVPDTAVGLAPPATSEDLHDFLGILEDMPIPVTPSGRENTAVELIDWVRLVGEELGPEEVKAVWDCLRKLDQSKLNDLVYALNPEYDVLWVAIDQGELREHIDFDLLFVHLCQSRILEREDAQGVLAAAFIADAEFKQLRRLIYLVAHYLPVPSLSKQSPLTTHLLLLLARIFETHAAQDHDLGVLKELVFTRLRSSKGYFLLEQTTHEVVQGVRNVVKAALNPANISDQTLVASITSHWLHLVQTEDSATPKQLSLASLWLQFLPASALLGLLDAIQSRGANSRDTLQVVIRVLHESPLKHEVDAGIRQRLPWIITLQNIVEPSDALEDLIARGINSSLPAYLDGQLLARDKFEESSLLDILNDTRSRWKDQSSQLPADLPIGFLSQSQWSKATVAIGKGLLYRRALSEEAFTRWLQTGAYRTLTPEAFIPVLRVALDVFQTEPVEDNTTWKGVFDNVVTNVFDKEVPQESRLVAVDCLAPLFRMLPSLSSQLTSTVTQAVNTLKPKDFGVVTLNLTAQLRGLKVADIEVAVTTLANIGVQWAIRLSSEPSSDEQQILEQLGTLVSEVKGIQASQVETYLTVVIQERLASVANLQLAKALVASTHLKPVVVNRHLQSIIQHPDFFKLCAATTTEKSTPGAMVVGLLHTLFFLHPNNTCQPSHIEPLIKVYHGTLATPDVQILSIFHLFEEERKTSISSLIGRWSSSKTTESSTALEAVQSLDPALVLRTTLNYPNWRKLHEVQKTKATPQETQLYDPIFLILLLAQTLAENPPTSALGRVEMFRTNIVGLAIRSLSVRDPGLRELALNQIAVLWRQLELADLHEKPHVIHILSLLKSAIPVPEPSQPPIRLPTYSTLLLAHAFRGVFYPSNFIYPITARFLLQRPEIDTGDVPLLFSMLYSSSDDWKKERGWILRFLADGMVGSDDWRVLKRRHTWDLLASMYQATDDRHLRGGILEVLASLTCHPQATMSLVLRSALLTWIESQLLGERIPEATEWVRILENIMAVGDAQKLETATSGEWRATISRCLIRLLDTSGKGYLYRNGGSELTESKAETIPLAANAIIRLSLLPGTPNFSLGNLLDKAVRRLEEYEANVKIPSASVQIRPVQDLPQPPFGAHAIHHSLSTDEPLAVWGHLVESLWRASMNCPSKTKDWDSLTTRLLVWRALVGSDGSPVGEWSRTAVLQSISNN